MRGGPVAPQRQPYGALPEQISEEPSFDQPFPNTEVVGDGSQRGMTSFRGRRMNGYSGFSVSSGHALAQQVRAIF